MQTQAQHRSGYLEVRVGGGHSKGAAFERSTCVQLSLWVSKGKNEDCFWRSSLSGGRATIAFKGGKKLSRQAGDICAISPEGHALTSYAYLECKFYKSLGLESFFLLGTGSLASFWHTTVKEARKHKREPVLIAKQNRTPSLVITKPHALAQLADNLTGMSIRVRRKGLNCEVRLFADVLGSSFKGGE